VLSRKVVSDRAARPVVLPSNKVTLLYAYGSLFFAGARNLEEDLPQVDQTEHAVVMLSLRGHIELGSTSSSCWSVTRGRCKPAATG